MNISELFLSFGKKTSSLINIILNGLLILTLSSLILSHFTADYSTKVHHLISYIPIFRTSFPLNSTDWSLLIQWISVAYLLLTLYYFFDCWLIPSGSNIQYLWETLTEIFICIFFIEIIIQDSYFFELIVQNILWTSIPIGTGLLYGLIDLLSTYFSILKDKKSGK